MRSLAERLAALDEKDRAKVMSSLTETEAEELLYDWRFWARPEQLEPDGDWSIWMVLAGRGFGKTRAGAEWVRQKVKDGAKRIALIAETAADGRDVMVEGESGILAVHPESERPSYEPSKRRLTWPNGAVATVYNATEPDQLRGPQFDLAWCDELAKWKYARETWDMLQFGLRLGDRPRVMVTTTPRPIELVKAIVAGKEGRVAVTRGRTLDNAANLSPVFIEKIQNRYAGTRLGRQELDAEILSDMPGALWSQASIDANRLVRVPDGLARIVVAVDPAVTSSEDADEHGIIVAGRTHDGEGVVLDDKSLRGTPLDWARRAISAFDEWGADAVVAETNQGGDMVVHTMHSVRAGLNVIKVSATRGKHVRAEPIASLYEQGRIRHVGSFPELENQMTQMTADGYKGSASPDRLDAMVWAFTELFSGMIRDARPRREAKVVSRVMPMARGW